MAEPSPKNRIENALRERSPAKALAALARAFKAEGMSQREMHDLFEQFLAEHENDREDTLYDAILDTMGMISGGCHQNARLFEWELPD
jgi:hypothetical protein